MAPEGAPSLAFLCFNHSHGPERWRRGQQVDVLVEQQAGEDFQRAAVGDDGAVSAVRAQLGVEGLDAGDEGGAGFAVGGGEAVGVGGPAVEVWAGDVVPGLAFPLAEIHFLQAGVWGWGDVVVGGDGVRDGLAALGGAGPEGGEGEVAEGGGDAGDVGVALWGEGDVEMAVADAGGDQRGGVADQGDFHGGGARIGEGILGRD